MMNFSPTAQSGRLPAFAALLLVLLASGCINQPRIVTPEPPPIPDDGPAIPETNTAVLSNNTQVIARTGFGRIKIEAGPGMRRVFTWNGHRRGVVLEPREEGFANGGKGIYFEGEPPVWESANGVTKVKVEEGHRRFKTADDALIWMQIRRPYFAYNNSGLAVGWRRVGDTLEAEVWQFYIGGETPSTMPKADNDSIVVGPVQVVPQKMQPQLVFADGRTEPYTAETAAKYSAAKTGGAGTTGQCNWFKQLFGQCTTAAKAAQSAAKSNAKSKTDTAAKTTTASASDEPTPAGGAAASGDKAASSADKESAPGKDESAPRAEIKGDTVNIRSGAGTDSKVLFQAKKGDSVRILKKDSDWRYVKFDDGRKGWVADFLLEH